LHETGTVNAQWLCACRIADSTDGILGKLTGDFVLAVAHARL